MRKLAVVLFAVGSLCLMAIPAFAAQGDFTFGLEGGLAMPMGDFGDVAKAGFNGGVFGDYWITPAFAFGLDGAYNRFGLDEDFADALEVDGNFSIMQFGAHGKYMLPLENSPLAPWFSAGVGFYNMKFTPEGDGDSADDSENKMGFNAAAGVDLMANPSFTVGAKAAFHHILTENEATQYFTVGLTMGFSTAAVTSK